MMKRRLRIQRLSQYPLLQVCLSMRYTMESGLCQKVVYGVVVYMLNPLKLVLSRFLSTKAISNSHLIKPQHAQERL